MNNKTRNMCSFCGRKFRSRRKRIQHAKDCTEKPRAKQVEGDKDE